jgi:hypothetical protein
MSRRTRLAVAVATAAGALAVAMPLSASTTTAGPPVYVWLAPDGSVCYSSNPGGTNPHCTG